MLPKKGLIEGKSETSHQGTPQINLAEKDDQIIAAVVVEANLVENKDDWILDTGASRQFYSNKALFHELLETTDGECVFMGKSTTAGVWGKGKILLKLTSGKTLALNDVLYVPSLRKNLVSDNLLNKAGLKFVLEFEKMAYLTGRGHTAMAYDDVISDELCAVIDQWNDVAYHTSCVLCDMGDDGYHTSYVMCGINEYGISYELCVMWYQ
ncbi:UNVERIFIED_CONTAM: hypothetical protein Sradi_4119400 [Sesamum radiatum]|uniref:Retrovirus-related Pol polyprotein from transposon TNT 1-94-like beta-barrel domain-containing protein n=1 Tax=Sesamum radiatum TaxID=300843 RepID=A0AAW2P1D7_SESRA